jgi:predicted enzyme related to lactoylglutathione lyase
VSNILVDTSPGHVTVSYVIRKSRPRKENTLSNTGARLTHFEIGSKDPVVTEKFFAEAFGWSFTEGHGNPYSFATTPAGSKLPMGGLWDSKLNPEDGPYVPDDYIVLVLEVDDLHDTCRRVEEAGGKVTIGPMVGDDGSFDIAHVRDPRGNLIGLYCTNLNPESARNPAATKPELRPNPGVE